MQRRFAKERHKLSESDPVCMSADLPERQGEGVLGWECKCECKFLSSVGYTV
jgi:hypothetical protein